MLITCNGCASKIRVPDSAAGKRVKCPKCATLIRVPEAESPHERAKPETTAVSSTPLPPPVPLDLETEPQETPQEPVDPDAFSTTASSSGSKPPPLKKKRASSVDDDDYNEDDEPKPPTKRRRKYDDEDDEDVDLDVRKRGGQRRSEPVNGMAMTSMVMGIISVTIVGISCCCCGIYGPIVGGPVGGITSITAIILGFMGKKPGSEGFAWSGIICGIVTLILIAVMIVLVVTVGSIAVLMDQKNRGFR
jgi:predicted Zn finger-like uncharacterized protein